MSKFSYNFTSIETSHGPTGNHESMLSLDRLTHSKLKSVVSFDEDDMFSHTSKIRRNISRGQQSNATMKRSNTKGLVCFIS